MRLRVLRSLPSTSGTCRPRTALLLLLPVLIAGASAAHAADGAVSAASFDPLLSLCLATNDARLVASWSLAPEIVLPLAAVLALYLRGAAVRGHPRARTACFLAGWLFLAAALTSPLCRAAASLAWAHMVQHVILVAIAPPLLVLAAPVAVFADAVPERWRGRLAPRGIAARRLQRPMLAGTLYAATIWLAHAPRIYEAALAGPAAHLALLAALLSVSLLFWSVALRPYADATDGAAEAVGAGVLLCLSAMLQTGLLGALITLSGKVWYPIFAGRAGLSGLTPLQDQEIAGAIMWVPMGTIYLAAGLALAHRWLELETSRMRSGARRRDRLVLR